MERVDVSRGPQGTVYGRNATAGALNLITRRPEFDRWSVFADVEYGDYDHRRVKGAINFPLSNRFALRVAAMSLKRDGYVENKAADVLPGLDDQIDSRDGHSVRVTGEYRVSDSISVRLMYNRQEEDDTRLRFQNQVCKRSELPTYGCDPNAFGLEGVNPNATFLRTGFASRRDTAGSHRRRRL